MHKGLNRICKLYLYVCRDNPRALANGLISYVQADKHDITILYHLHQCRPFYHEIFRAKAGKGGINPGVAW